VASYSFSREPKEVKIIRTKNREIKTLSKWLSQQKQNYKYKKHNMKNEKIKIKWEEFVEKHKEYFISNEEEWKLKLKFILG
jgi:hypothetical protein